MTETPDHKETQPSLSDIHAQIDAIDMQIQVLINQRAEASGRIASLAQVQKANGGRAESYNPGRDAQVLRAVASRNKGPLQSSD
ncbi:MAG: chorismate mutase [Granulosicoccus sp.]